ncbi:MAG TPA: RDD family protein [Thermoanaerobaculia bacterium]
MRFDEIELEAVAVPDVLTIEEPPPAPSSDAPRFKRLLALLTDLSLFAALALALSPLLPATENWLAVAALAGFMAVLSYYYFVGTWMLWGKTIGGAIFDVKVVPASSEAMSLRDASLRYAGVLVSLATAGLGFALAALPSRASLPDRVSATRCVVAA